MLNTNQNCEIAVVTTNEVRNTVADYMISSNIDRIKWQLRHHKRCYYLYVATIHKDELEIKTWATMRRTISYTNYYEVTNPKLDGSEQDIVKTKQFIKQLVNLLKLTNLTNIVNQIIASASAGEYTNLVDWYVLNCFSFCDHCNHYGTRFNSLLNCITHNSYVFNKFALYWTNHWADFKKLCTKNEMYIGDMLAACTTEIPECRTLALTMLNKTIDLNNKYYPQYATRFMFTALQKLQVSITPNLPFEYITLFDDFSYSQIKQVNIQLTSKNDLTRLVDIMLQSYTNNISHFVLHLNGYVNDIKELVNLFADLTKITGYDYSLLEELKKSVN